MELVEKAVRGLEAHVVEAACRNCPYDRGPKCVVVIKQDALTSIRECVDEIERLRAQVHNLTLYLRYLEFDDPASWAMLEATYDGLPGYDPGVIGGTSGQ